MGGFVGDLDADVFGDDEGVFGDAMYEEDVAADGAVRPDDGFAAEDCGAGVDCHAVFDGGVAFAAAEFLHARGRLRAEGDAVVDFHIVADDGSFSHHRAGAVVDKKVGADFCPGVQVDAGATVRPLTHDAWDQCDVLLVKFVCHALDCDGLDERVGDDHLLVADCGGVAGVGRLDVGLEQFADGREGAQKFQREFAGQLPWAVCRFSTGRFVLDALGDFVLESAADAVHQHRDLDFQLGGLDRFLVKETGQQQPQQVGGDRGDGKLRRQIAAVQMVDAAHLGVGGDQVVGQLGDAFAHGGSIGILWKMARRRPVYGTAQVASHSVPFHENCARRWIGVPSCSQSIAMSSQRITAKFL